MRECWLFGGVVLSGLVALGCADEARPSAPQQRRALTLLHSSDLHSRAWPFRTRISDFEAALGLGTAGALVELGGFAGLGSLLEGQSQGGPWLWLDSGDALEGAPLFPRFGGQAELELLGRMGLGAMVLGNHELSLSGAALAQLLEGAAFPVLSANLRPAAASELSSSLAPALVLRAQGVRVGLVGAANASSPPQLAHGSNPWGLAVADVATAVQVAVDELAGRADLVVVLSHLGLEGDRALVSATSGIDLVLGGHEHRVTLEPEWQDDCAAPAQARNCRPRAVPIVHSGAYGKLLSRLELRLEAEPDGGGLELAELRLTQLPNGAAVTPDAKVQRWLEPYWPEPELPLAFLPEPLRRRSALGGDSALGNLVADALRQAAGADVALLNSSGLRGDLEAGPLLRAELELALPFEEPWLVSWLRGQQLRAGVERAARRSAARDCTSSLQLSGLVLTVTCAACRAGTAACLQLHRPTPFGVLPVADTDLLQVVLPAYLALPGGDFEHVAGNAQPALASASAELAAQLLAGGKSVPTGELARCARELRQLSPRRCREGFGVVGCPLAPERAVEVCRGMRLLTRGKDARIVMQP